eukprot:CAMPEP_0198441976 /NCGR_PEP_ID=MMETSP1452-20131203/64762_1 /TAXON_ID=1181717 /ORGANISM="Synchroma pusillum, Strain CCMP3072" /LENGTH=90 /DNA_ID=CAMNT_0044162605 /DNA_START=1 /DNA_END=270 /DNA_ORIENTATION=+
MRLYSPRTVPAATPGSGGPHVVLRCARVSLVRKETAADTPASPLRRRHACALLGIPEELDLQQLLAFTEPYGVELRQLVLVVDESTGRKA